MDIQMPNMGGVQATAAIRGEEAQRGGHIPIVGLTANAMQGDRERYLEAGMDGYVPKPVRADALFAELDRVLEAGNGQHPERDPVYGWHSNDLLEHAEADLVMARQLAEMFLRDYPAQAKDIGVALDAENSETTAQGAHALRGPLATMGLADALSSAEQWEQCAGEEDLQGARDCLLQMDHHVAEAAAEITTFSTGGLTSP
jgi:protein-histidine pros-kinase